FDAVLAMYHDQGLIPFKSLSFSNGTNFTAGLNVIRTSPDHGVAYDIAGKNKAEESSFRQAIYVACDIHKNRLFSEEINENPLEEYNPSQKVQLITILDVVEHLPHPHRDFKKMHEILDDNGSIVLVTPNIESTQRKLFGRKWFQFKPREHISYFSPHTLGMLAEKNGFKIIKTFSSGQYADLGFINHRLHRYEFTILASVFEKFMRVLGLKDTSWYINTGSILTVLQKA
ncbi:MAG: hypothetical protein COB85_00995, partial [Bacteroidetes bacterium]